jgi:photosystem II stability/assembly factor-like uncharacterized protein
LFSGALRRVPGACCLALLLLPGCNSPHAEREEDEEREAKRIKPPEEGWVKEADADAAARSAAQFQRLSAGAARPAGLPSGQWSQVGPQSVCGWWDPNCTQGRYTGNVRAIAVHPINSSILFIGADSGGVFRSRNNGNTWQPVTDSNSSLFISSLAIDPGDPNTIYAGTSLNVLKSRDGGDTWHEMENVGRPVYGVTVSPADSRVILAATPRGVERSADGGETWALGFAARNGAKGVLFASGSNTAYASIDSLATPVMTSKDGGVTWASASGAGTTALPGFSRHVTLAVAASNPNVLYAGAASVVTGSGFAGLFRSADGGASWTRLESAPNYCGSLCTWWPAVAVHPRDPNVVMAAGVTGHRSLDGGATWTRIDRNASTGEQLYVDKHAITFSRDGSTVYVGDDGGVHEGTNVQAAAGISWKNLNAGLNLSQFYAGFSLDPEDSSITLAGAQDTGAVLITSGAARGLGVSQGDCGGAFVDPLDRDKVYFSCFSSPAVRSYSRATQRLTAFGGAGGSFIPLLLLDRRTPSRF